MNMVERYEMMSRFAAMGGVFAVLVFWHFFADWLFQTHVEAMAKAKDRRVRAMHCLVYAGLFVPLFAGLHMPLLGACYSLAILFTSHFVIDSYIPVLLWAKYLRRAPQFSAGTSNEEAFKAFAATPIGLVLMIVMDQFFHIAFLLPIAWVLTQ